MTMSPYKYAERPRKVPQRKVVERRLLRPECPSCKYRMQASGCTLCGYNYYTGQLRGKPADGEQCPKYEPGRAKLQADDDASCIRLMQAQKLRKERERVESASHFDRCIQRQGVKPK